MTDGGGKTQPSSTLARKVAVNTAALMAGRAVTVVGGIAVVTLASRYLSLGEYGAFITAFALVGILEVLTDLGVYTMSAREIARDPEQERRVLGNALGLSLTVAVMVAVLGWVTLQLLYPGDELVPHAGTLLLLGVLVAPLIGVGRAHFVAAQRAFLSALGEVASLAVQALLIVLTVVLDWGFTGVVAAYPAGRVAQGIVVTALVRPEVRLSFAAHGRYWRHLLVISIPLGAAMAVNFLYFRLDALLLSALRSAEEVALYGLAYKVVETMLVVPAYFMVTLFPEIARMGRESLVLQRVMGQALAVMEMLALPVLVLTAVFAEEAVTLIGGAKFGEAATALQILAIALALSFLNGVYGHALVALGRQASLLKVTLIVLAANVAMNLVAIPLFGIEGAAAAVAVSELINVAALRRMYVAIAPAPSNALRTRMRVAAAALLVSLAAKLLLPLDGAALVAVGASLGLCCYVAALITLRAVPEAIRSHLLAPLSRLSSQS